MKLLKEFLKDKYTLWLMRVTLLFGLLLSAFNDIAGYFFLVMFTSWYIAVIFVDSYLPANSKYNLFRVYTRSERPKRVEIIASAEEIDPLFLEDIELNID